MTTHTDSPGQLALFLVSPEERITVARVHEFAAVLRAADLMPFDEDEYFERPWKWQTEYQLWTECGCPPVPDPASSVTDLNWERFVRDSTATA